MRWSNMFDRPSSSITGTPGWTARPPQLPAGTPGRYLRLVTDCLPVRAPLAAPKGLPATPGGCTCPLIRLAIEHHGQKKNSWSWSYQSIPRVKAAGWSDADIVDSQDAAKICCAIRHAGIRRAS